jgi:hypothetical protein
MSAKNLSRSIDDSLRKVRILFLAANPAETTPLDLEEELRTLESELRGVKFRDSISLTAKHAVRPDDLLRYVRATQPTVIHFSGHGSTAGIVLRSDNGRYTELSGVSLSRFLKGRGVELLVLNACYTKEQGIHVADAVPAIVGTTAAVEDEAARRFTAAFYRSLGDGLSIAEAFRDGSDATILHGLQDVFWSSGQLDRVLCAPEATAPVRRSKSSSNPRLMAEFERQGKHPFRVVTHVYDGVRHYSLRMFVKNPPSDAVNATYTLHESFHPQKHHVHIVDKRDFTDWLETYGDFEVRVTFYDDNRKKILEIADFLTEGLKRQYRSFSDDLVIKAIDELAQH